ncbi:MAG: thioesterase II family protein [Pyrinomonadaceae bacterium]
MSGSQDGRIRTPWFNLQKSNPRAKTRLFCFPYAGGGPSIYRGWEHYLPAGVDVWPVQLPGRGSRYNETPYASWDALVTDLAEAIKDFLDLPFSFFGHSLGALLSFELALRLRGRLGVEPLHLFVSGCRAPQLPRDDPHINHLPDEQFIKEVGALNGTPREVLENRELLQTVLGALRADFRLAETYACSAESPLGCPVTAFGGSEDAAGTREEMEAWELRTTGPFNYWILPGDHFFIHTSEPMVLQILSREFRAMLTRPEDARSRQASHAYERGD